MARKVNRRDGRSRWKDDGRDEGGHFLQTERRDRNRGLIVIAVALLVAVIVTAIVASRDDSPEIELIDVETGAAVGTLLAADTGPVPTTQTPTTAAPTTTTPATTAPSTTAPSTTAAGSEEAQADEDEAVFRPAAISGPGFTVSQFPGAADEVAAAVEAAALAARYPIPVPPPGERLSVYVGGDSLSDAPRVGLVRSGALIDLAEGTKISSGLVATWFFDWPAHLEEQVLPQGHDVIVLTFGGNDAQPIGGDARPGTDMWRERYAERVERIAAMFAGEAQVIWIGLPHVEPRNIQTIVPDVNGILAAAAERWPHVTYVDALALFSDAEGQYARFLPDPADGELVQVRAPDGVHYTPKSGEWLAEKILAIISDRMLDPSSLWEPGEQPEPAEPAEPVEPAEAPEEPADDPVEPVDEGPNEATESTDETD